MKIKLTSTCILLALLSLFFYISPSTSLAETAAIERKNSTKSHLDKVTAETTQLQQENKPDSAIVILREELKQIKGKGKKVDEDKAHLYYLLGNVLRQKGNYADAVANYEKGLSLAVKHSMFLTEARILNSLGGVYVETESYRKGLDYIEGALDIYQKRFKDRKQDICLLLTNVGNIQVEMGAYDKALVNLNKALSLNLEIENDYYFSLIYSGIGLCHLKRKEFTAAIRNLDLAMKSSQKSGNVPSEIANMANLGSVFIEQKDFDTADSILQEAHSKALATDDKYLIKEVLSVLINLNQSRGDYEASFKYQEQLIAVKDSLFTKDLNDQLAISELNYENVKKEKKILALKVENQRQSYQLNRNRLLIIIGLIVVLLLGLGLIVLTQRNKLRNTRKIAELQNKMFRSQMRPHFIFNVLSSIQTYMSNNDGKKAAVFLSKFARLMRNVLEQSQIDFNSMSHETNILSYYLELQQLRFEDGFDFNFDIDKRIDPDIYLIPPLILQPILENAIEHGFQDTSKRGNIEIVFRLNNLDLFIEITDNGIGINSKKEKVASTNSLLETESLSMKIISEQLEFYSKRLKNEYFMKHEDLFEFGKTGTKVTIKMPYQIQKAG